FVPLPQTAIRLGTVKVCLEVERVQGHEEAVQPDAGPIPAGKELEGSAQLHLDLERGGWLALLPGLKGWQVPLEAHLRHLFPDRLQGQDVQRPRLDSGAD